MVRASDESDEDFRPTAKPPKAKAKGKKEPAAPRPRPAVAKPAAVKKRRRKDEDGDAEEKKKERGGAPEAKKKRVSVKEAAPPVVVADEQLDPALLEKYRALKNARETDVERLLHQARELALEEQKTHEALVARLRKEIKSLAAKLDEQQQQQPTKGKKSSARSDSVDPEAQARYDSLQRKHKDVLSENETLRVRIRELETHFAQFKRSTGPDDMVIVNPESSQAENAWKASETTMQLAQANKLLEMYRLVTSTDIRLIETGDDDASTDSYTDIACTTTDGESGKRFDFELAIPDSRVSEIEYLPGDHPPSSLQVPSYLQDELSFKRSEMTKFMRTVLDVVIKKANGAHPKR